MLTFVYLWEHLPTFCTKQAHEGCVKDFNCARRKTVNSCYCFQYFIIPARNSGRFTWVRLQQLQEQRYLLLPVCPVFRIFNVGKKMLPAITHGICAKIVRVCTENWEKNPLPRRGLEPVSVLRLAVPPSALPTVISPPLFAESATLNSVIRVLSRTTVSACRCEREHHYCHFFFFFTYT